MTIIESLLEDLYPLLASPRVPVRSRPSRMLRLPPLLNLANLSSTQSITPQPRGTRYISVYKIPIHASNRNPPSTPFPQAPKEETSKHPQAKRNCDTLNGDYDRLHRAWKEWVKSPKGHDAEGKCTMTFAEWLLAKQS